MQPVVIHNPVSVFGEKDLSDELAPYQATMLAICLARFLAPLCRSLFFISLLCLSKRGEMAIEACKILILKPL